MTKRVYTYFIPLLSLIALIRCGAVNSTTALLDARNVLQDAKNAEAPQFAPYEYAKAELYVKKAKELQGYTEYQQSILYAMKAKDLAFKAISVAKSNKIKMERIQELKTKIKK